MKPSDNNNQEFQEAIVRKRVRKIKSFYNHLTVYVIGVLLYLAKTHYGAPFNFWPFYYVNEFVMWFWTIFLVVQGLKLFFAEKVFGNDWEQRKMNEFLNKDKRNKYE